MAIAIFYAAETAIGGIGWLWLFGFSPIHFFHQLRHYPVDQG
jgi:hypothetical protein